MEHAFEDIEVKENAVELLEYALTHKRKKSDRKVYGGICFGMGLTLREGNREYFYEQLDRLFPHLKEKYIQTYKSQYMVESPDSNRLMKLFYYKCTKGGMVHDNGQIFQYLQTFEEKDFTKQLSLWDYDKMKEV